MDILKEKMRIPVRQGPKRSKETVGKKIRALIASHDLEDLVCWNLHELPEHVFVLTFQIDEDRFKTLVENWLGRRILITNRHDWSEKEIISAYWGQAQVEYAFKNMKNPFHLALRPQYHWTAVRERTYTFDRREETVDGRPATTYVFHDPGPRLSLALMDGGKYMAIKDIRSVNSVLKLLGLPPVTGGVPELASLTGKRNDADKYRWDGYERGVLIIERSICRDMTTTESFPCIATLKIAAR